MNRRAGPVLRAAAWLAFLGCSLAGLHRFGTSMPDLTPGFTATGDDLARMVVGAGRVVALAIGWYLLLATVLLLGVRGSGRWRAMATADAIVPALVRRAVHGAVGLTLITAPAPALAAPASSRPIVHSTDQAGSAAETMTMRRLPDADAITMRRLPDGVPAAPTPARTWTIAPGDHLWSIAEQVLADHLGTPPTDAQVDPYWRQLIEANRHRLVRPEVPDLVHPGQVLEIPPPV